MQGNHGNLPIAVRRGSSIVYYRQMAGMRQFWDDHWREQRQRAVNMLKRSADGYLGRGTLASSLVKHLPRKGIILEAGCGLGQYVLALRARGYDCRGVDFAEDTVQWVLGHFPSAPLAVGDILHLPFPDGSIAAYLSFGVAEHFADGPDRVLNEAHRVLEPRGRLLLSVPQTFPLRLRRAMPEHTRVPHDYAFYQYAFAPNDFRGRLAKAGFNIAAECGYSCAFGLGMLLPEIVGKNFITRRAVQLVGLAVDHSFLWPLFARMRLFVAVKADTAADAPS
jgi:SAM-dependent methyltransferase